MRMPLMVALVLTMAAPALAQDHVLCSSSAAPPFTVTSGSPFTVSWVQPDTTVENGTTVPNRTNGFYVQIDAGAKNDVGLPSPSPACSTSSQRPGDVVYTYKTPSGVARGSHTLKVSSWNFALDGAGAPTTNRQESGVVNIPFSAGDPILFGAPTEPQNIVITK